MRAGGEILATHYRHYHTLTRFRAQRFTQNFPSALSAIDQPRRRWTQPLVCKSAAEFGLESRRSRGTSGDELFAAYKTFRIISALVRMFGAFKHLPPAGRRLQRVHNRMMKDPAALQSQTRVHIEVCTRMKARI